MPGIMSIGPFLPRMLSERLAAVRANGLSLSFARSRPIVFGFLRRQGMVITVASGLSEDMVGERMLDIRVRPDSFTGEPMAARTIKCGVRRALRIEVCKCWPEPRPGFWARIYSGDELVAESDVLGDRDAAAWQAFQRLA